jgi:hypothetical protein
MSSHFHLPMLYASTDFKKRYQGIKGLDGDIEPPPIYPIIQVIAKCVSYTKLSYDCPVCLKGHCHGSENRLDNRITSRSSHCQMLSHQVIITVDDSTSIPVGAPSAFGRNLQCQPVRGVNTREEWHWSHAWQRFKRSKGVKLNGTTPWEGKFLSKTAHRAQD